MKNKNLLSVFLAAICVQISYGEIKIMPPKNSTYPRIKKVRVTYPNGSTKISHVNVYKDIVEGTSTYLFKGDNCKFTTDKENSWLHVKTGKDTFNEFYKNGNLKSAIPWISSDDGKRTDIVKDGSCPISPFILIEKLKKVSETPFVKKELFCWNNYDRNWTDPIE